MMKGLLFSLFWVYSSQFTHTIHPSITMYVSSLLRFICICGLQRNKGSRILCSSIHEISQTVLHTHSIPFHTVVYTLCFHIYSRPNKKVPVPFPFNARSTVHRFPSNGPATVYQRNGRSVSVPFLQTGCMTQERCAFCVMKRTVFFCV